MPKSKHRDSDSDGYILRKIRKLEKKLKKRGRKRSSSTSTNGSDVPLSLQKDNQMEESVDLVDNSADIHEENTVEIFSPVPPDQECNTQNVDAIPKNLELDPEISDMPSTSEASSAPVITLDESILELLGETPTKNKTYSSPIQADLAVRWEHIVTSGLSKDLKKELLSKYFVPENCLKLGAPKLNPEIKAALSESLVKKDKVIETKQV